MLRQRLRHSVYPDVGVLRSALKRRKRRACNENWPKMGMTLTLRKDLFLGIASCFRRPPDSNL